jgi:lipopolysaccharide export system permease protein
MATELEYKSLITEDGDRWIRQHKIEAINKFTLSLSCLIFFFIGAPLGAIIRRGGLGVPIIVSVLVFIVFYILDNMGFRMARSGIWTVWFGKTLATAVLAPLAVFVTYKANNDSAVFNLDAYRDLMMRMFGLRRKRTVMGKEVIINDPDYVTDRERLVRMNDDVVAYAHDHNLKSPPNIIKVFFKYKPDNEMARIDEEMEVVIEDLSNTRDKAILTQLSKYPFVTVKAHTRPFERKWLNILSFIVVPVGAFFYLRMWRFLLRLYRDLQSIRQTNNRIIKRIDKIVNRPDPPKEKED